MGEDTAMIPEITHAQYVWSSYAIFALIVGWQFVQPLIRRKRLVSHMLEAEAERRAAARRSQ
jgi:heme exporter protein CcmD